MIWRRGDGVCQTDRLSKATGIPAPRLNAIQAGDHVSRGEIYALAVAWRISPGDLIASFPDLPLVAE